MFSLLHEKALKVAANFKRAESELISLLQEIESCRGYSELGYTSLFTYVNQCLGLSEACAYQLIVVSRKSITVPELQRAIARGETTVSKAKVIASVITRENQAQWLAKASLLPTRALEKAVAESRPEAPKRDIAKPEGNGFTRLNVSLDEEAMRALERARELLAQKKGQAISLSETVKELTQAYVKRHDPVAKADRNHRKALHVKSSPDETTKTTETTKTSQNAKIPRTHVHAVHHRDRGACQYQLSGGELCASKQWIHIHHIQPKSEGGPNTKENLITLCSAHHRLLHAKASAVTNAAIRAAPPRYSSELQTGILSNPGALARASAPILAPRRGPGSP